MDDVQRPRRGEAGEQSSRAAADAARSQHRREELLAHARSVRERQKAAEGGDVDPLVRARRAAARLRG